MSEQIMDDSAETYSAELRELVERAQHGDETAMPELRELLNGTPELWQQLGDLARHVETSWIKLLASNDLLTQESLRREAERRRTELLGDDPTAIEVHLVERITATWLQLQHAEIQMGKSNAATEQQLNYRHKRLESAQKQHAAAIDQLTKIRKEAKATTRTSCKKTQQAGRGHQSRKPARNRVVAT